MPPIIAILSFVALGVVGPQPHRPADAAGDAPRRVEPVAPINGVIGDASWIALHGSPPDARATQRIPVHLRFVADRLSTADVSHLTASQRSRRRQALAHLRRYTERGVFPRRRPDDGYGQRRPRFIDDRGVHCAVGELIRASGHAELARAIDRRWSMAYVRRMRSPALLTWARDHGFTVDELAMIQPYYGPALRAANFEMWLMPRLDALTLSCAARGPVPRSLTFGLLERGGLQVELIGETTAFARCVSSLLRGRAISTWQPGEKRPWKTRGPEAVPLDRRLTVPLEQPREIVLDRVRTRKLDQQHTRCWSTGDAPARHVAIRVVTGGPKPLVVEARTTPRDSAAESCFAAHMRDAFHHLRYGEPFDAEPPTGAVAVDVTVEHSQPVHLTRALLLARFQSYNLCRQANYCLARSPRRADRSLHKWLVRQHGDSLSGRQRPWPVAIDVHIEPTATPFTVTVEQQGASADYARCFEERIERQALRGLLRGRDAPPYPFIDTVLRTRIELACAPGRSSSPLKPTID